MCRPPLAAPCRKEYSVFATKRQEDTFMLNPDTWQSHAEYHINFKKMKVKFPSELRQLLWDSYRPESEKLFSLNLDPVEEYLARLSPAFGRPRTCNFCMNCDRHYSGTLPPMNSRQTSP